MTSAVATLLRIYVNASDRWEGRSMCEAVVAAARAAGLAGASVFPVVLGYGGHAQLHDAASDYQFLDAPVVIEIVDDPDRIQSFAAALGPMLPGGLVTFQSVHVHSPSLA